MSTLSSLTSTLSTLTPAEGDLKVQEKTQKELKSDLKLPMPSDLHTLLPDAKTPWSISNAIQTRFNALLSTKALYKR